MERLKRTAILACLIDELNTNGNRYILPRISQVVFFLQNLAGVPLGFGMSIPFGADVRDELESMINDGLICYVRCPDGSRMIAVTDAGKKWQDIHQEIISKYKDRIAFITKKFSGKDTSELDLMVNIFRTMQRDPDVALHTKAHMIMIDYRRLSEEQAIELLKEAENMIQECKAIDNRAGRELSVKQLVVNCLYSTTHMLPTNELFDYLGVTANLLKARLENVTVEFDRNSFLNFLYYDDRLIARFANGNSKLVGLSNEFRDDIYIFEVINGNLDNDIRVALPSIAREAYQIYHTQGRNTRCS